MNSSSDVKSGGFAVYYGLIAGRKELRRSIAIRCLCLLCLLPCGTTLADVEPPIDFYREIRPILMDNCLSCHGGVKRQGGVSFVSSAEAMNTGRSGKRSLVPGDVHGSEMVRRIISDDPDERMPAGAEPLSSEEIERMRRWVAEGAFWPDHWAFAPLKSPPPPPVINPAWIRNSIDSFVLSRLEGEHIRPSPEADRHTLIRRLSLDLTGLLPAPSEIEHFVMDNSDGAYERLVNRLLASPHFGERWARHWLDLARYADTDGYEVDGDRPHAWHWRDWVIQAINEDMPFDRFTLEQLAGDLLPEAGFSQRLATAFHRQTLTNKEGGIDEEEYRVYAVMDRVNTTATVWLGLTLSCAQCHDHPHDPMTQREFYQWFAFFNNADETRLRAPGLDEETYQNRKAAHQEALEALRAMLEETPEGRREDIEKQLEELSRKGPKDPAIHLDVLAERNEPRKTHLFHRGEFLRPIKEVEIEPGVLEVLQPFHPRNPDGLPDRLDLAEWLIHPENPLTPRVAVNHVWMRLFGEGLVRTADDFGLNGELPSHPELLDWLAAEFIRLDWSRKELIRLIVTSAAYRQLSSHRPELSGMDPENRMLHRQNRFRMEAEILRDSFLGAAGLLSLKIGGPSVYPPFPQHLARVDFRSDMNWVTSEGEDRYRRGMYTFFKRTLPHPNLTTFDCPDASATTVQRRASNTPLQALATLNNEVFVEAVQALAAQLARMDPVRQDPLEFAFQTALGRQPSLREDRRLRDLFEENLAWYEGRPDQASLFMGPYGDGKTNPVEAAAWAATASILLNLDEFITRE